jgi:hypothetical protein
MTEKSTLVEADRENGAGIETPLQIFSQEKFPPESSRERKFRVV